MFHEQHLFYTNYSLCIQEKQYTFSINILIWIYQGLHNFKGEVFFSCYEMNVNIG